MDWKSHRIFSRYLLELCSLPKPTTYSVIYSNAPDLDFFPFRLHRWRLHRISKFGELIDLVYLQRADVPTNNMAAVLSFMSHLYLDAFTAPVYCFGYPLKTYAKTPDFSNAKELTISLNQNKCWYAEMFYKGFQSTFASIENQDPDIILSSFLNELWDQTSNKIFNNCSKNEAITAIKVLVPEFEYDSEKAYPFMTKEITKFLRSWRSIK